MTGDETTGLPEDFLDLAPEVYRDDPLWIPEDLERLQRQFSPDNPWFEQGRAAWFCVPGRSRLAAFVAPGMAAMDMPAAWFGLWESVGDPAADRVVFEDAERWARDRGAACVVGPIDFSTYGRYRLRIGGDATSRPFLQEPYNPEHYPGALEALGYAALPIRYFTRVLDRAQQRIVADRLVPAIDHVSQLGYRIERLTPDLWLANLPQFHALADAVFSRQFGYTPLPFDQFSASFGARFIARVTPDCSFALIAPDGAIAGFVVCNPDWSPLLAQGAGSLRLRPDDIELDHHLPHLRQLGPVDILGRTGGVADGHRGHGAMGAMFGMGFRHIVDSGDWARTVIGVGTVGNGMDHLIRDLDVTSRYFALFAKEIR